MKMNSLRELKNKLEEELLLVEQDEDIESSEEDEEEEEKGGRGRSYEYRSTARQTKGKAFFIDYDVDYRELMEFLEERVPNVSWTVPKTRETFKAIREFVGFDDPRKSSKNNDEHKSKSEK
jgi:hypothetical protein